jgi:hypothetical protein
MQGYAEGVPIDTDAAMAANSDAFAPSQRAVKTRIEARLTAITAAATETTQGIVELSTTGEAQAGTDGSRAVTPAGLRAATREKLLASRTYYVRTDGNDSNTGLVDSAVGAFLTTQKAVDVACGAIDAGIYDVVLQHGAGTYTLTTDVQLKPFIGSGQFIIRGNTSTLTSCVFGRSTTGHIITSRVRANWKVEGFTIGNTGSGSSDAFSLFGAYLEVGAMRYTAITRYVLNANNSVVIVTAGYTVAGACNTVLWANGPGGITHSGSFTVTVSGTPAWSGSFAGATGGGVILPAATYSGTATGTRYLATLNGVINTFGGGANYLPGNAVVAPSTGGQYA